MRHRLQSAFGGNASFEVKGEPTDLTGAQQLASEDPFQFQFWALGLVGARPVEEKKGADRELTAGSISTTRGHQGRRSK